MHMTMAGGGGNPQRNVCVQGEGEEKREEGGGGGEKRRTASNSVSDCVPVRPIRLLTSATRFN